ncbi:MAG: aldo/keto reductase [Planctomycetaceae bacterium]|nr:aldo/keto reductase [Planctomycetaceae bacterium]
MQYRTLGRTGLQISTLSFGAGPISTLMVGDDADRQCAVVELAIQEGVNWFDTAATYGGGQSERQLGRALAGLKAAGRVHVATKVRLTDEDLGDIRGAVRRSFEGSLDRLRLPRVTLLQLHNSLTARRGDEPTSVTPHDVLKSGGIADAFDELRAEGLVSHLGLTGIGQPDALREAVGSGRFETMQVPYHLLNPSAGREMPDGFAETNYGHIIADCARQQMGVLAIRVLAGGALADNPPSPHTLKTPFFPLALYERDRKRAATCRELLGPQRMLPREAIRYVLAHPHISSALIGFGECWQIVEALEALTPDDSPVNWDDILRSV